ncbi:ubiquitin carboxyl-terminal hydrolase 4 [Limosa lapponica baueri]|uniref:Ubiquitin carboxyl-terminal hydrolase 4 n=1 Tax=Limosa lapponica baueri TaxID=1758121 RepID=A0A2I0TJ68_LIMLA|nr:ubiquitin carboxyl-terminal hydrolase 4 [Limosa lapponica baueri]
MLWLFQRGRAHHSVLGPGQYLPIVQHPQETERETRLTDTAATPTPVEDTAADTAAIPIPATDAAATPTLVTGNVVTPSPVVGDMVTPTWVAGTAAESGIQPVPISVAPIQKKKYTKKSVCLVRDDNEPGPSREQEEETEPEIITRSLSLSELRDMRKDFSRLPGEYIVTWLLRCWDNGASSLELEGREPRQLGSLSREGGIDKAIGKKTQALSLWRQLLSGVRERYPFSEDVVCHPSKWTTMEKGIQYLGELAMQDVIYHDLDDAQVPTDPDEIQCTGPTWWMFVRSAPLPYANSLAVMEWKGREGPMADEVAGRLRQYEESLSSPLISAVEKLSQKVQHQPLGR